MASLDWDDSPELRDRTFSNFVRGMRTLWELTEPQRRTIVIASSLSFAAQLVALPFPLLLKYVLDAFPAMQAGSISTGQIVLIAALLASLFVPIFIVRFAQEPVFLKALIWLESFWPVIAQKKLLDLHMGYHERENTGKKISKVTKGVDRMVAVVADLFWVMLPSVVFTFALNIVILFVFAPVSGAFFMALLIPAIWIYAKSFEQFIPIWMKWETMKESAIGYMCQTLINVRSVQAFVQESREIERHETLRKEMYDLDLDQSVRSQKYLFLMEFCLKLGFVLMIATEFMLAVYGLSTIGSVTFVALTGTYIVGNVTQIVQLYNRILRYLVAAERMKSVLDETVEVQDAAQPIRPSGYGGAFAFERVSFGYEGRDRGVLRDFSLSFKRGEMLALVGKSGSGKSTTAKLLARVFDPTDGRITLDGVDVRQISRDWYRRLFATVHQDVEIFDGSIRENVAYAYPEVSDETVKTALRAAHLHEAVLEDTERFVHGLDTEVGERGVQLSGGERQRVGIARAYVALLSGAKVLILDEATSNLDSQAERAIQEFIEDLRRKQDISILAIAHRLSTIRRADTICVLDSGRIAEIGNHAKLLKQNGLYARLVELQQLGALRD